MPLSKSGRRTLPVCSALRRGLKVTAGYHFYYCFPCCCSFCKLLLAPVQLTCWREGARREYPIHWYRVFCIDLSSVSRSLLHTTFIGLCFIELFGAQPLPVLRHPHSVSSPRSGRVSKVLVCKFSSLHNLHKT